MSNKISSVTNRPPSALLTASVLGVDERQKNRSKTSVSESVLRSKTGGPLYSAVYAGVVHDRLKSRRPELADQYARNLLQTVARTGDNQSLRKSADSVLHEMQKEGVLSAKDCSDIRASAAKEAASLQRSLERPESKAPTVDRSDKSAAQRSGALSHQAQRATHFQAPASSQTIAASSQAPQGFLWKPVSDSDSRLAILLPPAWSTAGVKVFILDPSGDQVLAEGKWGGIGNGDRAHFRFDKAGGQFTPGVIVEVRFPDGSKKHLSIAQTGSRIEGGRG